MDHCIPSQYPAALAWSMAVLLGMVGLGRGVARAVCVDAGQRIGWGLHAVWGMTLYLFIGAALAACGILRDFVITLLICVGIGILFWTSFRSGQWRWRVVSHAPWNMWPAFLIVSVFFAGGVLYWGRTNVCDDTPAYYYFCEKLLDTGSFDEPFSWRRMASLGGHTLLQSSVIANSSMASVQAFEVALCPLILLGLILGFRQGVITRTRLGLCLALAAVTTPIIRVNSASHLTGVVLLVGLFVTLDFVDRMGTADSSRRLRWLCLAGAIAAGVSSLRAQNVPAAIATLGLFWLASWIRDRRPRREMIVELGCVAGAVVIALLPWMIMSYRSNGTPLYPLLQGNNNGDFNPQALSEPLIYRIAVPVKMVLEPALLPLFLCLLAMPKWNRSLAARAVAISTALAAFLLAYSISLAPDDKTIPRYVQPLLLAGAIVALMAAAAESRSRIPAWAMTLLWIGVTLQSRADLLWREYAVLQQSAEKNIPYPVDAIVGYRKAQELVPAGKRMLVCTDYPLLFDQKRNPVWIIDMPNAVSPAPGLPFQKPPEEMKRYLRGLGVDYLVYTDFSQSNMLYNRRIWVTQGQGNVPLFRIQAPYYLDFFDTIEAMTTSKSALGRVGNLNVIDLQ